MKRDLFLAIDNGTQSVRALIFDPHGDLLAKVRVPLDGYVATRPTWHEHDVDAFWTAVCTSCNRLWEEHPALRDRIAGVAITTQRGTVVNLDSDGRPLRKAITWLDQRKSPTLPPLPFAWRSLFALTRLTETITYFQTEAEANWIAACEPDIWNKTSAYLLLSGYLLYRFTGRMIDSIGSQVGYLPFDFKALQWADSRDWKWNALPITRSMLPDLVEPGTVIASITDDAAAATGIPRGTPIIAAAADKACEVLGSGCVDPTIAALSYGTTATINTVSSRYLEATRFVPPYPSAIPRTYDLEVQIFRGYWMVNWFKEQFGLLEQQAAERTGTSPEALFDQLVGTVPAGSMGLVLQPYWTPGVKTPGPEAKGAIIGFGDMHTRAHIYRAILEGLAFGLREGAERIVRRSKTPLQSLRVSGGGSQSDAAMQITADIFGLPVARPHVYETSGLGAAIDAAVGLGIHPDFATAVQHMTRIARTFAPNTANAANAAIYDALYRRVYLRMYERLKPLYHDIREITNSPSGQ